MASKTTFQVPPEQTPSPPPLRPRRSKREAKLKLSKALGDAAREARQKADLTQADVAERIGVATEVYGRLERGLLMPSVPTLRRVCLALHLSADALLALSSPHPPIWEEPPPPSSEQEPPAMRRLLRNVRKLNSTQIRALSLMASTLRREGED
ncbi:helix-turn-helix domain-containing protein [Archangium violaceum]|uniref:helix-turn-helix domain-containing protein n=1 Tax=Archangium violaceum TaxID=83451 RepID=UPI0036DC7CAE